jgi:hypothetical protein
MLGLARLGPLDSSLRLTVSVKLIPAPGSRTSALGGCTEKAIATIAVSAAVVVFRGTACWTGVILLLMFSSS